MVDNVADKHVSQVHVKGITTKSDAQFNDPHGEVPCKAGDPPSEGVDRYEFVCQERLAAEEVIIKWAGSGSGELAEVVVVGKTWGKLCHLRFSCFVL